MLALTCRKIEGLQYLKCKINQLMRSSEIKALARGRSDSIPVSARNIRICW
ncbi:MAG: hypothetical protein ACKERG_00980 [Candidatus Hodgkinia cicadicola]